jgi:hypothetical protein
MEFITRVLIQQFALSVKKKTFDASSSHQKHWDINFNFFMSFC